MKKAWLFSAAAAVLLAVPAPLWANEGAEGGKSSLPQLDATLYPGLLFWLAVVFFLFFLFMQFVGVPGVRKTQENRASILGADLAAARAASEEAQKVVENYESALAKARQEAAATVNGILVAAAKETEKRSEKLHNELTHRTQVAEENIAAARQKAMEDAPKHVNDLVLDLYDRVTKVSMGAKPSGARG